MRVSQKITAALLLGVAFCATPAFAQDVSPLRVSGEVKAQYLYLDNQDLDQLNLSADKTQALDARLKLMWSPVEALDLFSELRALKTYGDGAVDNADGTDEPANDYFELRQYWARFNKPFGLIPANIQLGRQRISEPYGFWWNKDLDALRFNYDATLLKGFVGVGQNLHQYRSGDDDFVEADQDRFRSFGQLGYQWRKDHFIEGRVLHEDDHSGARALNTLVSTDNTDESDATLTWFGGRVHGTDGPVSYRLDLVGLQGDDRVETTTAAGSLRRVTANTKQDVSAWAVDAGVGYQFASLSLMPTVYFGYAYGSGDDNSSDGKNKAFRQSGLQSNSSKFGNTDRPLRNYGEVFRPELSNLHILTFDLNLQTSQNTDLSLVYHAYRRAESATGLGSDGLSINPSTTDDDIGQEIDAVYNIDLKDVPAFQVTEPVTHAVRFSLGAFKAGDAYGAAADETTVRGLVEWRMRF